MFPRPARVALNPHAVQMVARQMERGMAVVTDPEVELHVLELVAAGLGVICCVLSWGIWSFWLGGHHNALQAKKKSKFAVRNEARCYDRLDVFDVASNGKGSGQAMVSL